MLPPAKKAYAITPVNATPLPTKVRGIYVGGAGNLNVILSGDTANTLFTGVPVGTTLDLLVTTVHSTGTTATNLVGLY